MSAPFGNFDTLENLIVESAAAARPPERLTVSEAAAKYRKLNNPGAYVGDWVNDTTPYLVEPMDELQSQDFTGLVFAGPAQCGKTDMAVNWIGYSAKCDPADIMLVQTSQPTARDFSMRRIDRLHRHSPDIGDMLIPGRQADNTFDKQYKSGMLLTLAWPSINELSGKPIPRLWLTDYDRMPADIDGEGAPFDLARKRATTFRSFGMCAAESSPGFVIENPKWIRSNPHDAPPTKGILGLFNRGDRRRWYWSCVNCEHKFEPSFELMKWPDTEDIMAASEQATMHCPNCDIAYHHDTGHETPGKHEMNRSGRWIKCGQRWLPDGRIVGTAARSSIASFWLKGVAATFSDWQTLVFNFLSAEREYENTGSEEALKTTINTDQGEAYLPKSLENDRVPEQIKSTARDYGEKTIPPQVRFLVASIDVQKNRFVVQVQGIAANRDVYVIDRFDVRYSKRKDPDREGQFLWVNPGAYIEDWKLLNEEVLLKSYPLEGDESRKMGIKLTVCDSGGREGVTANAYDYYRWLRREPEDHETAGEEGEYKWEHGLVGRFLLVKGASAKNAPRIAISYPDSQRKDRSAGARGEIPVLMINPNNLKDMVDHRLNRTDPGGRFCFPKWLDDNFYIELTVEIKDPRKGWINPKNYRNESWDLLAYCMAATLTPIIGLETIDWEEPPTWALPWDENDMVFDIEQQSRPMEPKKTVSKLSELAGALA